MRALFIALMLAIAGPAVADSAPRLVWLFSDEPEGDAKLGITSPEANTYAQVLMRCRPGSGRVRLSIDIDDSDRGAIGAAISQQRQLLVELTAEAETAIILPNLAFNHHDELWQYAAALDLSDPLIQGLSRSGRLSIKGLGNRYQYEAADIAEAWPAFTAACKRP